jgi:hypothetical protein
VNHQNEIPITEEEPGNNAAHSLETIHGFDGFVARSTQVLSQATLSRRSFLGSIGKLILAIVGASVIPLLPSDREVEIAEAADPNCSSYWYYCNMFTPRTCPCTCGVTSCPYPTQHGNNPWIACCSNGSQNYWVKYYDCCGGGSACAYTTGCYTGRDCSCYRPPSQQLWCGGVSGALCCTYASVQGTTC